MSGQHQRRPTKSWALTIFLAGLAAITPFINDVAEEYFGITITQEEVQHLATLALGSAAIGGVSAAHKRREKRKEAEANGGGGHIAPFPPNTQTAPDTWTKQALMNDTPDHPKTDHIPGFSDLDDDDFDDDDDDLPPPKDGGV